MTIEILEFDLGGESYAMDIQIAREIVEMLPITPIPRAPAYVTGLLNLRGEITTIINIHQLLGIKPSREIELQNIMVLVPESTDNTSIGIIVDEVHSVLTIDEEDIDNNVKGVNSEIAEFVQGIIKFRIDESIKSEDKNEKEPEHRLIIWIDVKKILMNMVDTTGPRSSE